MENVIIYTDGGCRGNSTTETAIGGYGYVILYDNQELKFNGGSVRTTNNRMEFKAALEALHKVVELGLSNRKIQLFLDSQLVINTITKWAEKWEQKKWYRKKDGGFKNLDLVKELYYLNKTLDTEWIWVKGHNNNKYNEMCDLLCNMAMNKIEKLEANPNTKVFQRNIIQLPE